MKKVNLTKKEMKFIRVATNSEQGVYDFENTTNASFKKDYGISKKDVGKMLTLLQQKMDHLLAKKINQ